MIREGNGVWLSEDENGKSDSYVINKQTGQKLDVDIIDDNFEMKLWVPRAKPVAEVGKRAVIKYKGQRFKAIEPEDDEDNQEGDEVTDEEECNDEEKTVNMVFIGQV